MSDVVVMKDSRLKENILYGQGVHVFGVGPHTSIYWAWQRIKNYAKAHGKLKFLIIECHGFEGSITKGIESEKCKVSVDPGESRAFGGYGLQLCKELLTSKTVSSAKTLQGAVDTILVYSCSAGDPFMANLTSGMTSCSGIGLVMRNLAINSNATVYASDATQFSRPIKGTENYVPEHWAGNVYEFKTNGVTTKVASYPHSYQ